ncbi:glycosyltransferase [Actinoplanes sp. NPDC020271]|uniref:glycosyltransferase n=1 Tax=Actinoplanes sp. NPDC020271 TaxID=3363896 RepID=UPI0037B35AB0
MSIANPAGPVVIFSAGIGAGHDGAARELSRRLAERGIPSVRYDFLDMLPAGLGTALRDTYARQLRTAPDRWGWLLDKMARPRLSAGAGALSASLAARRMLAAIEPDTATVVSTYPLASQVLGRLRRSRRLAVPVAAVMTDPSVHPLCVAEGVDLHLAPGRHTAEQIHALNAPVLAVSPVVDPAFRPAHDRCERDTLRHRFGLPLDERLAVVIAGSWGVGDVEQTALDIVRAGAALPVVVCGRNETLRRRLHETGTAIALGWVDAMPELLRAADVAVTNAGGLSSTEAMASGIPVISYRCLPGHGDANAAVLAATGLSPWPQTLDALAADLRAVLDGPAGLRQQAVFAASRTDPDAADVLTRHDRSPLPPLTITIKTTPRFPYAMSPAPSRKATR